MPAWLAFASIRLLEEHFPRLVSYEFTAGMEDVLDEIAGGRRDRNTELAEFYFGSARRRRPEEARQRARRDRRPGAGDVPVGGPDGIDLRVGRYGPYIEGPGEDGAPAGKRANVPEDLPPDELTLEKAKELLANPAGEETELGEDPETGDRSWRRTAATAPTSPSCCPRTRPKPSRSRAPARCSSR